nr:hypothetical protein StreXyl84_49890 [Streptomyces sp. Xyl84]
MARLRSAHRTAPHVPVAPSPAGASRDGAGTVPAAPGTGRAVRTAGPSAAAHAVNAGPGRHTGAHARGACPGRRP